MKKNKINKGILIGGIVGICIWLVSLTLLVIYYFHFPWNRDDANLLGYLKTIPYSLVYIIIFAFIGWLNYIIFNLLKKLREIGYIIYGILSIGFLIGSYFIFLYLYFIMILIIGFNPIG